MKKLCSLVLTFCVLLALIGILPVAAAGSLNASASDNSVIIDSTVTVTLAYDGGGSGIGSLDAEFTYDADTFQFVSCAGAAGNAGAGLVRISYFADGLTGPTTMAITLTFKAIAAGDSRFAVKTVGMWDDNDVLLGNPNASLSVAAINPTKSANANLTSLKPSSGTLVPAFSANTTEYTIDVPYSTTSLNLSATTEDRGAKTTLSGSNTLTEGKNTRVITVTAANGTTKKYTVIIIRAPKPTTTTVATKPQYTIATTTTTAPGVQSTTTTTTSATQTTTTTAPAQELLEVSVDGVLMSVLDTQPETEVPRGFTWDFATLRGVTVSAARNEKTGMVLLYLENSINGDKAFYIYDEENDEFFPFRTLTVKSSDYVLLDVPASLDAPVGTASGTLEFDGNMVSAFLYTHSNLTDYTIVYATSPEGNTGLYVYDSTDGSLQRYHETPQPEPVIQEEPDEEEQDKETNPVVAFIKGHRQMLLLGAAVCGGLALLVVAIAVLATAMRRNNGGKCKH